MPEAPAGDLDAIIRAHARLVNDAIARYLPADAPGAFTRSLRDYVEFSQKRVRPSLAVYEPMRHVIDAGGKRIRPTLCLLACEAMGGRAEMAVPTAAGIEFLHTFTLVHDDIMDRAMTRRSRPTVGALWGDNVAICAGDGLFALAFRAIASNAEVAGVDPARVLRVVTEASETSLALAQGQTMDLQFAQRTDVDPEEYLEMIRLKTGVLLEFSLMAGAVLGGGSDAAVGEIGKMGPPLGMAFQVRDDILDLVGDEARTGKPRGHDIRTGKRSLPVCHTLVHADAKDRERFLHILDKPVDETTDAEVAEAIRIAEDAGAITYAQGVAEDLLRRTKAGMAAIPSSPGGKSLGALASLADYIAHRDR